MNNDEGAFKTDDAIGGLGGDDDAAQAKDFTSKAGYLLFWSPHGERCVRAYSASVRQLAEGLPISVPLERY